jgi:hypothetical protein
LLGAATAPNDQFDCFCPWNARGSFLLPTATIFVVLSSPPSAGGKI